MILALCARKCTPITIPHTQWIYCADADSFCTWCGHHDNPHQCCLCVPPYRSSLYLLRIYCRNPNCTRDDVKRTYYTSHSARPHLDPWKLPPTHKERSPWQKECQALYIANTQTPTSNDTAISTRLAVWMGEQRRIYIYIYICSGSHQRGASAIRVSVCNPGCLSGWWRLPISVWGLFFGCGVRVINILASTLAHSWGECANSAIVWTPYLIRTPLWYDDKTTTTGF